MQKEAWHLTLERMVWLEGHCCFFHEGLGIFSVLVSLAQDAKYYERVSTWSSLAHRFISGKPLNFTFLTSLHYWRRGNLSMAVRVHMGRGMGTRCPESDSCPLYCCIK